MAGETLKKVKAVILDLKSSWYFRIWSLLWLVCAIVAFVGFVILTHRSVENQKNEELKMWIKNESEIYFPDFIFRVGFDNNNEEITGMICSHLGTPLVYGTCNTLPPYNNPERCRLFFGSRIVVHNNKSSSSPFIHGGRIGCQINTTLNATNANSMIAWDLATGESLGTSTQWIAPNNFAMLSLEKIMFYKDHKSVETWRRTLQYHSTQVVPGSYFISIVIDSFGVFNVAPIDAYNGWMSTGDVGGFVYFLLILHTMVMLIVGLFLSNDSSYLRKNEDEQQSLLNK